MATARNKPQAISKSKQNARRVHKEPPAKSAAASSSRQHVGPVNSESSKAAQKRVRKTTGKFAQEPEEPVKKTGNKRKAEEIIEKEVDGPEYVKMPMLTPRVRNIPQEVVENKWGPLSEKAKDEFLEVMKVAERPVLMTFGNEKKRAEAQRVLDGALRRLKSALPKIPVPPMGKDMTLNYEKLLTKNRDLEAILAPELRQIADLEAEIEREQKLMDQDMASHRNLKNNAATQEKIRKEKARSMHPLLRKAAETDVGVKDGINDINLSSSKIPAVASSYDVSSDRQILPLTKVLQQHLSSMQGNSGPLEEVNEWILRSKAAVDEVLFQRAGEKVYDKIIGL
ncbi:uncharacterized protein H6S33_000340 [Morchella sextelata]|uniref:uncharacterized protein n=1 Tax=Morchella sextelata TaxID=1174677 RepID=UPI001D03B32C|nr:uncharacterized protein H6S33_000340 [Morchella sextelata]KAH0614704.1 hypothetical protein H6S33_000340 [Morchella sextelata]